MKSSKNFDMLTTGGVARLFGVHPGTVRRWCEQGKLIAYRTDHYPYRRFSRADVAAAYLDRSIHNYLRAISATG